MTPWRSSTEIGPTCLYAVHDTAYDPVSRHCTIAAEHPPPVVLFPDGAVEVVAVSA